MFSAFEMTLLIGVLLVIVFSGVHIAVALGFTAAFGIYLMQGDIDVVRTFIANTAYEALRDYVFAVIPLFMLMGEFLAKCGAATRHVRAGQPADPAACPAGSRSPPSSRTPIFAFVTGVSIAAAAAFSRIAYPEMKRHGYERKFALGCIAGSACLGMLIPPSVLMIVWGVLTEQSIGKLFLAGRAARLPAGRLLLRLHPLGRDLAAGAGRRGRRRAAGRRRRSGGGGGRREPTRSAN